MTAIETTGSGLLAALKQTWADSAATPELPDVVSRDRHRPVSSAFHIDANGATLAPTTGSKAARPNKANTRPSTSAPAHRRPDLFVSGECLAEGPRQTLQTVLPETVHSLAHVRGVKATSRGGKYHNRREFVALARRARPSLAGGQGPTRRSASPTCS
jgi:hypothetical protein